MRKKKGYIFFFWYFPVAENVRKKNSEKLKKYFGAELSWATAQLYCDIRNFIVT